MGFTFGLVLGSIIGLIMSSLLTTAKISDLEQEIALLELELREVKRNG